MDGIIAESFMALAFAGETGGPEKSGLEPV
jgi:hypothetical protein